LEEFPRVAGVSFAVVDFSGDLLGGVDFVLVEDAEAFVAFLAEGGAVFTTFDF